ncbi:alpha ketoglutarate dependent dioxygenase alkB [Trichuris trichiura]|uniref:DNA oxidative demethylase ALKBH2 n=1 Tax=Trichuris trichiura TaxID=36087 RepID=A0A077Z411_TRITR|nr:alpha ketoglutarate dependent dioxygenase alkB [Trichuris trichiura]
MYIAGRSDSISISPSEIIAQIKALPIRTAEPIATDVSDDLNIAYVQCYLPKSLADSILHYCEETLHYLDGRYTEVTVFNRRHKIPRQQLAMGNAGITYKFSGNCLPAEPWDQVVLALRDHIVQSTQCEYNFVLVNRYNSGNNYIGEHRDNETDLDPNAPICSLSLGLKRDFLFRHRKCRQHDPDAPNNVLMKLDHGSLLVMKPPTNRHWYHSLPKRRRQLGVRINFTFRKMRTV